ncbi:hypothetical protein [Cerasicoccus frondis]|uniref:hypothetical protein n=1 Tax=Cerasicoccus frondis TaxID=490090 RepID=UPI002852905B|nr:hypothetical protein [Cerasicoccus frondis]
MICGIDGPLAGAVKQSITRKQEGDVIMKLPKRNFHTLTELANDWCVDVCDIWQCLMDGELMGHIRVPLMCVFLISKRVDEGAVRIDKTLTNWEGFASLSRYQCQRFFEQGQLNVREFKCENQERRFVLPDETDDHIVDVKRLGVLARERKRFERLHSSSQDPLSDNEPFDPSFQIVRYKGREYPLGQMQGEIVVSSLRVQFAVSRGKRGNCFCVERHRKALRCQSSLESTQLETN